MANIIETLEQEEIARLGKKIPKFSRSISRRIPNTKWGTPSPGGACLRVHRRKALLRDLLEGVVQTRRFSRLIRNLPLTLLK